MQKSPIEAKREFPPVANAAREIPIIFSGPMVRALLAGRKTMTRRLLDPQPELFPIDDQGTLCEVAAEHVEGDPRPRVRLGRVITLQEIRWAVGDRLWVREAWKPHSIYAGKKPRDIPPSEVFYKADPGYAPSNTPWVPSIHMPRWASRLTLTVTAIKIEPLLDISEDDAKAEGFADGRLNDGFGPRDIGGGWTVSSGGTYASAAGMFQILWSELHPDWDGYSSPLVVALTFTVGRSPSPSGRAS